MKINLEDFSRQDTQPKHKILRTCINLFCFLIMILEIQLFNLDHKMEIKLDL